MNTKNLIDQLNTLIDQAPDDILDSAFDKLHCWTIGSSKYEGDTISRAGAKEIISTLIKELSPARHEIKKQNFTTGQLEAAMFNIIQEIPKVDERTNNPAVIDYAEHLARKIMYATKNTAPDTCEH